MEDSDVTKFLAKYSDLLSYIVIVCRDFTTHVCMIYFIYTVNRREDTIKNELAKGDSLHDVQELKTVLNSCRPLMSFSAYLYDKKNDHICLFEYIKLYDTLQDRILDLLEQAE